MSVFYKTQTVPITKQDVEKFAEVSEEEKALIGQVYIDKALFNAECSRRLKDSKKKLDEYATIIKAEEHEVPCRIEVDLIDNIARVYREDTGDYVRSRPVEDDERQATMFAPAPPVKTSEAAKAKSPGLKVQDATPTQLHVAKELHDNFGPGLAGEVVARTATHGAEAALAWGISEKLRRDAEAVKANNAAIDRIVAETTVPDDVRAAVLAADVPADLVENAITAIRDGADPATVIHNAKRAGKPEKPAKEKKPKGKSKTTQTKPLGMDEFDPQTDDTKKWEADLAAAPLSEEDRAALAASPLSKRGFQRVLKRMQAGATLTHAIEAEVEVLVEHAASLVGEDNWRLIDDEFERPDAFHIARLVESGLPFEGALTSVRMRVKGRTLEAKAEAEASA